MIIGLGLIANNEQQQLTGKTKPQKDDYTFVDETI